MTFVAIGALRVKTVPVTEKGLRIKFGGRLKSDDKIHVGPMFESIFCIETHEIDFHRLCSTRG